MISNKPLVSVIMATYNEKPNIIKSSIQSILDQSYSNFELLILMIVQMLKLNQLLMICPKIPECVYIEKAQGLDL